MRNMKAKNCASFFDAKQILESPAVEQVHSVQKSQGSPVTHHLRVKLQILLSKVVTCETSNLILPKEQCITSEFSIVAIAGVAFTLLPD